MFGMGYYRVGAFQLDRLKGGVEGEALHKIP